MAALQNMAIPNRASRASRRKRLPRIPKSAPRKRLVLAQLQKLLLGHAHLSADSRADIQSNLGRVYIRTASCSTKSPPFPEKRKGWATKGISVTTIELPKRRQEEGTPARAAGERIGKRRGSGGAALNSRLIAHHLYPPAVALHEDARNFERLRLIGHVM